MRPELRIPQRFVQGVELAKSPGESARWPGRLAMCGRVRREDQHRRLLGRCRGGGRWFLRWNDRTGFVLGEGL